MNRFPQCFQGRKPIIGSWFKENHLDGDVVEEYVREIVEKAR